LLWQYGVWMSFWHFQNFGKPESGWLEWYQNEIKMKWNENKILTSVSFICSAEATCTHAATGSSPSPGDVMVNIWTDRGIVWWKSMGNCEAMGGGVQVGRLGYRSPTRKWNSISWPRAPCRTQVHPASGHHCWDVCLRGRSRSGAYVGLLLLLPLLVNWGCMKRLLQCDYVCWQVQDRTMHAFGTSTTVKTEWLSCSCNTGLARHTKLTRHRTNVCLGT